MPHLVPILGTHPVWGNNHSQMDICQLWQSETFTQVSGSILLTDSYCFLEIHRWTHRPSPDTIV